MPTVTQQIDAVIAGAGFAKPYMLHRLRALGSNITASGSPR